MSATPQSDWILTGSAKQFWPLEPRAEDVCLDDIAGALSKICRFGGHCNDFYSVAQHAVLVSEYLEAQGRSVLEQFAGLHHDSGEAYLFDAARPVKDSLFVLTTGECTPLYEGIRAVEARIQWVIGMAFGIPDSEFHQPWIKQADNVMLMTERRDLMPKHALEWKVKVPHLWNQIRPMTPDAARRAFAARHVQLKARLAR